MIERTKAWFIRELDVQGSARACAVLRIIVMFALCYKSIVAGHPVHLDDPPQRIAGLALLVGAPLALVGYKTRLTSMMVALGWGYLHVRWGLVDSQGFAHGVQGSQSAFYVALLPSGKSMSVDRWLEVRRARASGQPPPSEEAPLWGVWVVAISMSCLYFWAGVDKIDLDWFAGSRIDKLWLNDWGSSDAFERYPTLLRIGAMGMAAGATVLELGLAFGLLIPRLRPYMVFPGLALHLGIWLFLGVWPFTMLCLAAFIVVIPPQRVHDFFETMFDRPTRELSESMPPAAPPKSPPWWLPLGVTLIFTAWCWQGPVRESMAAAPAVKKTERAAGTWHWSLLSAKRYTHCDVRYYARSEGQDRYIERLKTLGYSIAQRKSSKKVRAVKRGALKRQTHDLCQALLDESKGEPVNVRAQVRCISPEGWVALEDGARNVCEGVRWMPKKKKKKKKKKGATRGTR